MNVQFDLRAFTWFHPEPKNKRMVSIPNRKCVNISAALLKEIPHNILLGYDTGAKRLAIQAEEESPSLVPKSGSIKAAKFISFILESGVRLPARFTMEKVQDVWIGTLEDQPLPPILQNLPTRKRGRKPFAEAMKEADRADIAVFMEQNRKRIENLCARKWPYIEKEDREQEAMVVLMTALQNLRLDDGHFWQDFELLLDRHMQERKEAMSSLFRYRCRSLDAPVRTRIPGRTCTLSVFLSSNGLRCNTTLYDLPGKRPMSLAGQISFLIINSSGAGRPVFLEIELSIDQADEDAHLTLLADNAVKKRTDKSKAVLLLFTNQMICTARKLPTQ